MKIKGRTRSAIKIIDLQQELGLSEGQLMSVMRIVGIRLGEGQKNLDQNEAGRIRRHLKEQKRREELRRQTIQLPPIVKVTDFALALELPVGEILSVLLKNGVMATLNDDIDYETAAIIAEDLGYNTEESTAKLEEDILTPEKLEEILKKEDPAHQQSRPPVVTIMGHVDHGKTTLLDSIRVTNVAAGEAGGITQAISSYQVDYKGRQITFIDTPGHETFEFMRQRGASLADIAILVVAADDGVKPQTKEAVKHARSANVPIVVAINKIDKAEANVDRVKKELSDLELVPEEWGGKTVMVEVSALKKQGIDDLLEMVLLTNDLVEPKATLDRPALGSVVESKLDKHLGPLATVLIHTGTLHTRDNVVIGQVTGQVRRILDFKGKTAAVATPSMPVTIMGLNGIPEAGQVMQVVDAKEEARALASGTRAPVKTLKKVDENDDRNSLALVLKADSRGALEALQTTIKAMVPDEVRLSILRSEVGSISDSDVLTAKAGGAILYGFNVTIGGMAKKLAEKEKVAVKTFRVIYELIDDTRKEIEERLPVDIIRTDLGILKVLKIFFSTPKKKIVGGEIVNGKAEGGARAVIWRRVGKEKEKIGEGSISELQRERQKITHAQQGDQIGLTYEGKGKIKEGDVLEIFREDKVRRKPTETKPSN